MKLNHFNALGSRSRKRRYDERTEETQHSRFSVNSRLTTLHCLAFLLLQAGAMGKCQLSALSFHSPSMQSSISSAFIPTQSRLQYPRQATAIPLTEIPTKSSKRKNVDDSKKYKSRATFTGDATTTLELDAPMELVQEFLQSESSNVYLLGTDDIKCQDNVQNDESPLFECKQPILEFMGLKLQPIFRHKLYRKPNQVTASIEEGSKAEIVEHSRHPAKRVISSLVNDATFVGESVVTVHPSQDQQKQQPEEARLCSTADNKCKLSIALSLTLQIPMPRFIPIPPGFNALGSAIVRRTGRIRTKQLLERLKRAYYQHQQEQELQRQGNLTPTRRPSIPSFEDNFRRVLSIA